MDQSKDSWVEVDQNVSDVQVVSILRRINQSNAAVWKEVDPRLVDRSFLLVLDETRSIAELEEVLRFVQGCFQHIYLKPIEDQALKYVSPHFIQYLNAAKRQELLDSDPKLAKWWEQWNCQRPRFRCDFVFECISLFYRLLMDQTESGLCLLILELMVKLASLITTSKWIGLLLCETHFLVQCKSSRFFDILPAFRELVTCLERYVYCPLNQNLLALEKQLESTHYSRLSHLQIMVFQRYGGKLDSLSLSSGWQWTESKLGDWFRLLSHEELEDLLFQLKLATRFQNSVYPKEFMVRVLVDQYSHRRHFYSWFSDTLGVITEKHLLNPISKPGCSMQYLSLQDYVMRNLKRYWADCLSQVSSDIDEMMKRVCPIKKGSQIEFDGWSRRVGLIDSCIFGPWTRVPRQSATVQFRPSTPHNVNEWNSLVKGDALLLVWRDEMIQSIQGCEFVSFLDETRTKLRVLVDSHEQPHSSRFNILLKCSKPGFGKLVAVSKRMLEHPILLPAWLMEFILGYPSASKTDSGLRSAQLQVIEHGCGTGLRMISGPPGTGKKTISAKIAARVHLQEPEARILIVAHSERVLSQIFQLLEQGGLQPPILLNLDTGNSFDTALERLHRDRLALLDQVEKLRCSLNISGGLFSTSCESASIFYGQIVYPLWEDFHLKFTNTEVFQDIVPEFPFAGYFEESCSVLLDRDKSRESIELLLASYFDEISTIFKKLEHYKPLELLQDNPHQIKRYVLLTFGKIVGMSKPTAIDMLSEVVSMGYVYDTLIIQQCTDFLELESFVPISGSACLKRLVLFGDTHLSLSHSLMDRLWQMNVPAIQLNSQGRSRSSLCSLLSPLYPSPMSSMICVSQGQYQLANAGMVHEYQWIHVGTEDSEAELAPGVYQNLQEAEYIVSFYQYLRLVGHSNKDIAILTLQEGQEYLIRDVVRAKCSDHPLFGTPEHILPAADSQGLESDLVLISMARTRDSTIDPRLLKLGFSRAKFGLYIFGYFPNFEANGPLEMVSAFRTRGLELALVNGETRSTSRKLGDPGDSRLVSGDDELQLCIDNLLRD